MKTAEQYLAEANEVVSRISAAEAVDMHKSGEHVFVDVRDASGIAETGTIAGAQRVSRGMLEFLADDSHPLHNKALQKDRSVMLVCAAGGQAALAGKTLLDMGFQKVTNIGGIGDWKEAGGEMED